MIQFTQEEQDRIRMRSVRYPETVRALKETVRQVMDRELLVPKAGITDWSLYYYCPDCSVKLVFDREKPEEHACPCCGKLFRGEPYDGAWWELVNGQNYQAAYQMAVIWLATGEEAYARKGEEILTEYARNYPNYQVHGNIPYNGPGRAGPQTLDEANFLRTLAMAFDILSDGMAEEAKTLVREQMLLPGAEFLLAHRHRQLHNHEVIINSAIAVIGILFGRDDYVKAALYGDYGLWYQLEHGMQDNHIWFEGTFGYHFYALTSFFAFEKFALHTPYGNLHHPHYRFMMECLTDYLEPDGSVPMMNDTNYGHFSRIWLQYEFAYRELGGERLACVLRRAYGHGKRDNLEAFLYGVDTLPDVKVSVGNYHTETGRPGHTVLRGKDGRYLLFKHDRYGGEHDHYDRLGISYLAFGQPVARDLGTTGYGARLHYDYYKNTGTHDTMVIGEENQAPVDGRLTRYEERDGAVYVEAEADWTAPYQMPDTFTIPQWEEACYRTVRMRRSLVWTDSWFVEVFQADGISPGQTADWVWHINGKRIPDGEQGEPAPEGYFVKKPFCHLKDVRLASLPESGTCRRTYQDGEVFTRIFGMMNGETRIDAAGPDNPSTQEVSYLIERRTGGSVICAHVVESWKQEPLVEDVRFLTDGGRLSVIVTERDGAEKEYAFPVI